MRKNKINKTYLLISLLVFGLAIFGCVMVYSASFYSAQIRYSNKYFFLIKQVIGVILGIVGFVFFTYIDYHILKKIRYPILIITIVLLVCVFIPGFGVESFGAKRWINLLGVSIQPSELAKFSLVIFVASYLSDNHDKIKTFKALLPVFLVGGILCVLVILEPSMSVTMCIAIVIFFMLIVGGMSKKHTIFFSCCGASLIPLLIISEPYRLKRLFAFIDPWLSPQGEGFQLIQSLYSLGSGGWFGVGLFNSRQKYLFLPFAESDFIFSIIGEEFGYVGCIVLMLTYLVLVYLLIKIALNAKDRFGCLLVIGIAYIIGVQMLLNVAVVTGSIPPTGLPLPFISAGSTSLLVFMSAIGVVLNVDRQSRRSKF